MGNEYEVPDGPPCRQPPVAALRIGRWEPEHQFRVVFLRDDNLVVGSESCPSWDR
jgi:hypothetical protein